MTAVQFLADLEAKPAAMRVLAAGAAAESGISAEGHGPRRPARGANSCLMVAVVALLAGEVP